MRARRESSRVLAVAAAGLLCAGLAGCGSETIAPTGPLTASVPTPVPANLPPAATPKPPGPNPPVLSLRTNPSPASGVAPLDVHFNACNSFDPDGDALTFTFIFGDGQVKEHPLCRHDHTYRAGHFTATVCASDGANKVCTTVAVTAS